MNKIQNNNFLLDLYLDHDPILSIHVTVFSFSPEGCFQRRKENSSETAELWDLLLSVHSGNSVECPPQCGCLRFSSFFPTHTAHRNALDTSAARKKKGLFCAVHLKPEPEKITFYTTDQKSTWFATRGRFSTLLCTTEGHRN